MNPLHQSTLHLVGLLLMAVGVVAAGEAPARPLPPQPGPASNAIPFELLAAFNTDNGAKGGHSLITSYRGRLVIISSRDGGGGDGRLAFFDIADLRKPRLIHQLYDENTKKLREAHSYGYCTGPAGEFVALQTRTGIQIWDWREATSPKMLSDLTVAAMPGGDYTGTPWWTSWQAPYLFVGGGDTGLHVVDTSDPRNPRTVATVPVTETGGFPIGPLYAVGNLLLVQSTEKSRGIATLDIGDPLKPRLMHRLAGREHSSIYSGVLNGGFFYAVSNGNDKRKELAALHVYDVRDPQRIVYAGASDPIGGKGGYGAYQDGRFFAGFSRGVAEIDVRDPAKPKLLRILDPDPVMPRAGKQKKSTKPMHGDWDFASVVGNLLFSSSDHGEGSGMMAHTPADKTPPVPTWIQPQPGTPQPPTTRVGITFSDAIDVASLGKDSFAVRPKGGAALPGTWTTMYNTVTFCPERPFPPGVYEIALPAGGLRDVSGNALATASITTFSVGGR